MSLVERSVDGQNFVLPSYVCMPVLRKELRWSLLYINDANSGMMQSANNEICSYDYLCIVVCTLYISALGFFHFTVYNYSHCCIV